MSVKGIIVTNQHGHMNYEDGSIPWREQLDKDIFYSLTVGQVVVMGRKTWESIPEKKRPLQDRINVIISDSPTVLPGVSYQFSDLGCMEHDIKNAFPHTDIWVLGGNEIFNWMLRNDWYTMKEFYWFKMLTVFDKGTNTFVGHENPELMSRAFPRKFTRNFGDKYTLTKFVR